MLLMRCVFFVLCIISVGISTLFAQGHASGVVNIVCEKKVFEKDIIEVSFSMNKLYPEKSIVWVKMTNKNLSSEELNLNFRYARNLQYYGLNGEAIDEFMFQVKSLSLYSNELFDSSSQAFLLYLYHDTDSHNYSAILSVQLLNHEKRQKEFKLPCALQY